MENDFIMCFKNLCLTLCLVICAFSQSSATSHQYFSDHEQAAEGQGQSGRTTKGEHKAPHARDVDASKFRAAAIPDAVMLRWSFEHPEELKEAVLQRSSNGKRFVTITTLKSSSNAYTDSAFSPGCVYRIRMVAHNGSVVVSSVINLQGDVPSVATKR